MEIFKKACIDTWKSFGLSFGTVLVLVLVPAIFILLLSYIGEEEKASSEMTDNIVIAIIFILVAIVPTFLWNLLMAPFRLEVERLDKKIDECIHTDTVAPGEEPIEVDVSLYQKHKNLSLSQAACLWFSIDPHQATKDPRIKVMLSQLKDAIIVKDLSSNWGGDSRVSGDFCRSSGKDPRRQSTSVYKGLAQVCRENW